MQKNFEYLRISNFGILFLFIAYLALLSFHKPLWDVDMIYYIAISESAPGLSNEELFERTWSSVKARASEEKFQEMCCGSDVNLGRFNDPDAARSRFPLFQIKLGYIWLIKAFSQFVSPIDATLLINFLGGTAIAIASAVAFGTLPGFYRFLWVPSLLLLQLPALVQHPLPDAITAAFFAVAALCLLKRRIHYAMLLVVLGVVIRPDHIFVCMGFVAYLALQNYKKSAAITAVVASVIFVAISRSVEHIGWWNQFYSSLVEKPIGLTDFHATFDLGIYLSTVINSVGSVSTSANWGAIAVLCLLIVVGAPRSLRLSQISKDQQFILLMLGSTMAHFLAFPGVADRFHAPGLLSLLIFMSPWLAVHLAQVDAKKEPNQTN